MIRSESDSQDYIGHKGPEFLAFSTGPQSKNGMHGSHILCIDEYITGK